MTDISELISEEDVDILPYMRWSEEKLMDQHIIGAEDNDIWVTTKQSITALVT